MQNFAGIPQSLYKGQPFVRDVTLCRPVENNNPKGVPITIPWLNYNAGTAVPNVGVQINMKTGLKAGELGQIRSVYIDNTGSAVPIYVYFPDTGQTIVCAAYKTGWYRATTYELFALVFGRGFVDGQVPTTYLIFCNVDVPPSENIELAQSVGLVLASPNVGRGTSIYNSKYNPPTLGDQIASIGNFPLDPPGSTLIVVPQAGVGSGINFYYWNALSSFVYCPICTGDVQGSATFEGAFTGDVVFQFNYAFSTNPSPKMFPLINFSGANIKFPATQPYRLQSKTESGGPGPSFLTFNLVFTASSD